jgi:hypothetical protein
MAMNETYRKTLCKFVTYSSNKLYVDSDSRVSAAYFVHPEHNTNPRRQSLKSLCYHQCTRCAIVFHCDLNRLGVKNQCGNPFYNGKCNTCLGILKDGR